MPPRLAITAVALSCLAQAAAAQSSLTVQGRLDLGAQWIGPRGASRIGIDSGTYTASRLAIRGTEDLGDGASALFFLESGFNADTGAAQDAGAWFNRGSHVGLSHPTLGTLTFGRQYVPVFWPFLFSDEAGPLRLHGYSAVQTVERSQALRVQPQALSVAVASGTIGKIAQQAYVVGIASAFENNLVVYKTPSSGGFTASVAAGAPEGHATASRVFGANAEYGARGLYAGAGWTQKTGIVNGGGARQRLSEAVTGMAWRVSATVDVWGNLHGWRYDTGMPGAQLTGGEWMLGTAVRAAAWQAWANYARKRITACRLCGSSGFGLGLHRLLSGRTELYAAYGGVSNEANAGNVLNGVAPLAFGGSVHGLGVGLATQF